jgi:RES domain-containing protein
LIPKVTELRQDDTHRLIPSRYNDQTVLERLSTNPSELKELFELDGATNDRLLGESNRLLGISVHELLFGVDYAHVVNAAFTHARPTGSRFNSSQRGAWYAAFELETSVSEVAYHKAEELKEINWTVPEECTYDDYLADFRSPFHDIRADARYKDCLAPDNYANSQRWAAELLSSGSCGVVYPSVRYKGGTCLVCFRPALVTHVRRGQSASLLFRTAYSAPEVEIVSS